VWYNSSNPLQKLQFLIWNNLIQEINLEWQNRWVYEWALNIPRGYLWNYTLTVRVIDSIYYWDEKKYNVNIVQNDNIPPEIIITNPENWHISIYEDQFFNLKWDIIERSLMRVTNIYIDDKPYIMSIKWRWWVAEINKNQKIEPWNYTLRIDAIDNYFNIWRKEITLEILER